MSAILDFKMAAIWNLHLLSSLDIMQLLTWFWYLNVRFWGKESNGTNYHLVLSSICRHIGFQNGCFTLLGRFTIYIWHYLKDNVKCRSWSGHVMDLMYVCNVWLLPWYRYLPHTTSFIHWWRSGSEHRHCWRICMGMHGSRQSPPCHTTTLMYPLSLAASRSRLSQLLEWRHWPEETSNSRLMNNTNG